MWLWWCKKFSVVQFAMQRGASKSCPRRIKFGLKQFPCHSSFAMLMQEQLPLRPSEFVKIRDGFVAFLKPPAGTALEAVIPREIIAKMEAAGRKGASRQKLLSFIQISGVIVGVAGIVITMAINPMLPGACMLVGGGGV
jgi:hypothetical protein